MRCKCLVRIPSCTCGTFVGAVCCSVLQCVAVCCSVLQYLAAHVARHFQRSPLLKHRSPRPLLCRLRSSGTGATPTNIVMLCLLWHAAAVSLAPAWPCGLRQNDFASSYGLINRLSHHFTGGGWVGVRARARVCMLAHSCFCVSLWVSLCVSLSFSISLSICVNVRTHTRTVVLAYMQQDVQSSTNTQQINFEAYVIFLLLCVFVCAALRIFQGPDSHERPKASCIFFQIFFRR